MSKISFIMPPIRGGGPRNVYTISKLLNENGLLSSILSPYQHRNGISLFKEITFQAPGTSFSFVNNKFSRFDNLSNINAPLFYIKNFILDPRSIRNIGGIDLYIATAWQTVYSGLRISNFNKKPLSYFVQAYESTFSKNKLYKKFANQTYAMNLPMFTQSKWLKNFLDDKYSTNVHWIGLGIDHKVFKKNNVEAKKQIFTIARTEYDKGFDVFVEAMNELWKKRNDVKIIIAGTKNALCYKNIQFKYEFLDWIRDDNVLSKLYSESIFVNTGRQEAIPMPPIEAMASGSSVVISNIEGAEEYTVNNQNCIICDVKKPKEFSEAISELLDNNNLRETISKNGMETSKKYNWEDVLKRFVSFAKKQISG
ncbi:MAG: glycosyltransferase family 4 protein [Thermoplasmataceae archaeon]